MKNLFLVLSGLLMIATSCSESDGDDSANNTQVEHASFNNNDEKYSYCWGMNLGMNRLLTIERFGIQKKIDLDLMEKTFRSSIKETPDISKDSANTAFSLLFQKLETKQSLTAEELKMFATNLAIMDAYAIKQTIDHYNLTEHTNFDLFLSGYHDVLSGKETRVSEEDANQIIANYFFEVQSTKNQEEGQAFLKENALRDSVKVTDSGLQYQIIRLGNGPKPTAASKVRVHYRGSLLDGKVFDSSYERGPTEFYLGQVISGWTEGLQLMPVGSFFRFFIPSNLAYGERPQPGSPIPPMATLIFDVELLDIVSDPS